MFRLSRNERSHWSGNGVHVEPESVFMIGRNMHIKREVRKTEADGRLGAEAEVMINTAVNAVYRAKETETVERTQNIARYICTAELTKLYTKKTPQ